MTALAISLASADGGPRRKVVLGEMAAGSQAPGVLARPEGRSRWDATKLELGGSVTVTLTADGTTVVREEAKSAGGKTIETRTVYSDPDGGDGALRWLFPDRYDKSLRPGSRRVFEFDEESARGTDRLRADVRTVGIGWIHLPSGPHEVVLQRALVLRAAGGGSDFVPDALIHRWVDPRQGVVAEVSGPVSQDGRTRTSVSQVTALNAVIEGASTLKIHVSEITSPNFTGLTYGYDLPAGTTVASLDPNGYTTAGDLIAANSWDFSGDIAPDEIGFITAPVDPNETCNYNACGYTDPNGQLERSDKNFDNPDPNTQDKVNDVVVKEDRASDVTIWVEGGAQHEGVSGSLGSGESRFCYVTFGGVTRTMVPLWRFSHLDPNSTDWYFQSGDSWYGGPFNCEQNLFNEVCGGGGLFSTLWTHACGAHTGTQGSTVLKGGVVTVPSGHTFNALLIKSIADFCVYLGSSCSSLGKVDEVNTINYLWQVPIIGTVARIQSDQNVADANSFTTLAETNMAFGLFPPRSISVTGSTDTTVSLSWDPGLITNRIDGYKIYWDTDSGSVSSYAFDSEANPGQVAFNGTTAVISGLSPGTSYYFTVTSLSDYPPDPNLQTFPQHKYESIVYPTTVSGDPNFVYPVEVQGTTTGGTCIPTEEVSGVTLSEAPGGYQFCWNAATDPCLTGYQILGSSTVDSDAGFAPVADVGIQTCWTGNPSGTFFLVIAKGTGGNGPWGHYGH